MSRELVYVGCRRTPGTSLLPAGHTAEFFATVHDALLALELVPEDPTDTDTADGRPATRWYAHGRLSRMLGGDPEMIPQSNTLTVARRMLIRVRAELATGVEDRIAPGMTAITSGSGEFLLRDFIGRGQPVVSLADRLGPELSACAPAHAVAVLAAEGRG